MRLIATVFSLISSVMMGSDSPTSPKPTSFVGSDKKGPSDRPFTPSHLLSVSASTRDLELGDGAYGARVALLRVQALLTPTSQAESRSPTKEMTNSPLFPLADLPLNPPGAGKLANTPTMSEP